MLTQSTSVLRAFSPTLKRMSSGCCKRLSLLTSPTRHVALPPLKFGTYLLPSMYTKSPVFRKDLSAQFRIQNLNFKHVYTLKNNVWRKKYRIEKKFIRNIYNVYIYTYIRVYFVFSFFFYSHADTNEFTNYIFFNRWRMSVNECKMSPFISSRHHRHL